MLTNNLYQWYARLFAKPAFMPFHRLLYRLAIRGMGILNSETDEISGEAHFVRFIRSKNPKLILDVGANEGQFAQLCLRLTSAEVISFEPHPVTYQKLQKNIQNSRWRGFEMGLGSENGELELFDHAGQAGSQHASFQQGVFTEVHQTAYEVRKVAVKTLDSLLTEFGNKPIDLLKIDVEGFELEVLKGARQLLADKRIRMVLFEFNSMNIASHASFTSFEKLLEGYDLFRLMPSAFYPLAGENFLFKEIFAYQNLLAIRRD